MVKDVEAAVHDSNRLIKISQMDSRELGEPVKLDVVVREIREIDTSGRDYSQTIVVLEDRTGKTNFPIWQTKSSVENELVEGHLYTIYATIGRYKDSNQLKYVSSMLIEDTYENRKLIDPNSTKGITEENEKAFLSVIETKFDTERYKRYAEVALGLGKVPDGVPEEEYRERLERFRRTWCSINHHDNYEGGLWNHVVGMIRILLVIKKLYSDPVGRHETKSEVNWDHLLLLCVLHDLDKESEYMIDNNKAYYNPDSRVSHRINSIFRLAGIHGEVERKHRLTFSELEDLKYGLLCHHGQYGEFELKSAEDRIFHSIDMIDSANVDKLKLE